MKSTIKQKKNSSKIIKKEIVNQKGQGEFVSITLDRYNELINDNNNEQKNLELIKGLIEMQRINEKIIAVYEDTFNIIEEFIIGINNEKLNINKNKGILIIKYSNFFFYKQTEMDELTQEEKKLLIAIFCHYKPKQEIKYPDAGDFSDIGTLSEKEKKEVQEEVRKIEITNEDGLSADEWNEINGSSIAQGSFETKIKKIKEKYPIFSKLISIKYGKAKYIYNVNIPVYVNSANDIDIDRLKKQIEAIKKEGIKLPSLK